jgi:carbamate kinase
VAAALRFLRDGGQRAIITSAELLGDAAAGTPGAGTAIEPERAAGSGYGAAAAS